MIILNLRLVNLSLGQELSATQPILLKLALTDSFEYWLLKQPGK
jgi:hypothetical protein